MRQPARHRNGYHRTVTKAQRRNRWLLYLASALLVVGVNRCAVSAIGQSQPSVLAVR